MLSTILPEDQKQKLNEIKAIINKLIEIAEEVSKRAQLKEDKVKTVEQILKIAENIESTIPKAELTKEFKEKIDEIRKILYAGGDISYLVPELVAKYIKEHNLYTNR